MKENRRINKSVIYTTTIMLLIVLTLGSISLATWALLRTRFEIGGKVSFIGNGNVLATVSNGRINGVETEGVMKGFSFDENFSYYGNSTTIDAISTWGNLDLTLPENESSADNLYLTFNITNNCQDKNLLITTDTRISGNDNMLVELDAINHLTPERVIIAPGKLVEYMIVFGLDEEKPGHINNFNVRVQMANTLEEEPTLEPIECIFEMLENGTYEIKSGQTIQRRAILPFENAGVPITAIGEGAFAGVNLWSCIIPESIVEIKNFALADIRYGIVIPSSVNKMGDGVFCNPDTLKSRLKTVILEQAAGSVEIGNDCFASTSTDVVFCGAVWTCGSESYSDANPPENASALNNKTWTITK